MDTNPRTGRAYKRGPYKRHPAAFKRAIDASIPVRADAPDVWTRREARPAGHVDKSPAGENGACSIAEGATAPETLRQKGRGSDDNAGKCGFVSAADGVSASNQPFRGGKP